MLPVGASKLRRMGNFPVFHLFSFDGVFLPPDCLLMSPPPTTLFRSSFFHSSELTTPTLCQITSPTIFPTYPSLPTFISSLYHSYQFTLLLFALLLFLFSVVSPTTTATLWRYLSNTWIILFFFFQYFSPTTSFFPN